MKDILTQKEKDFWVPKVDPIYWNHNILRGGWTLWALQVFPFCLLPLWTRSLSGSSVIVSALFHFRNS